MSVFDEHPLTDLDRKALAVLGEHVVVKSLAGSADRVPCETEWAGRKPRPLALASE